MENRHIVIMGANPASEALIATLNRYDHQITLIDNDSFSLQKIAARYDIRSINEPPSHPKTLASLNLTPENTIIALTGSDETNLITCHIAKSFCSEITCYIGLKTQHYQWKTLKPSYATPVKYALSYNQSIFEDIQFLLNHPEFLHINTLCNNYVTATLELNENHPLINFTLGEVIKKLPDETLIAGLHRKNMWIKFRKNIKISEKDKLLFITQPENLAAISSSNVSESKRPVMILGISSFTEYLCLKLDAKYDIIIIEPNRQYCDNLALLHPNITILNEDPLDENVLHNHNIQKSIVLACSKDDEDNLIHSFQACENGAQKVFSLISHLRQGHVFDSSPIDHTINTPQIICDEIIRNLLKTKSISHFYTKNNLIQLAELTITKTHPFCKKTIQELMLPPTIFIGCIIRDNKLIFTEKSSKVYEKDTLVIYSDHKRNGINPLELLYLNPEYLLS